MTVVAVLLTVAYVAVAALLLNLNLATRAPALLKAGAIVVVSGLYAGAWIGHRELMGWATSSPLPDQFRVQWIMIEDPDKLTGEPGYIYFWVRELDEARLPRGAPRAHRIAWTEEDATAAEAALARMDEGELLNGQMSRGALDSQQPEEPDAAYPAAGGAAGTDGDQPTFEFARVPPPALPPKGRPEGGR
jgi:hypothetical protein